jgi:hypothetical protein
MKGYQIYDYNQLNDEERRAVEGTHYILNGDMAPLKDLNNEELREAFGLLHPCKGCVPDEYVDGDLHNTVRRKFSAVYGAAANLAERDLEARGLTHEDYDIRVVIDVSTEDCTYVAIVDWRDKWLVRYYRNSCKAWHFKFESLKDLATDILDVRNTVLRAFEESRELQLKLGRLGRDV